MFKRLKQSFLILLYLLSISFFYYWLNSNQFRLKHCVGLIEEDINQAIECFSELKQKRILTKNEEVEADFRLLYCYFGKGDFKSTLKQFKLVEPFIFTETEEDILPVYLYIAVNLKALEPIKAESFFAEGVKIIEQYVNGKELPKVLTIAVMDYLVNYCEQGCTNELKTKVGKYFALFSKNSKIPVEFEQRLKKIGLIH